MAFSTSTQPRKLSFGAPAAPEQHAEEPRQQAQYWLNVGMYKPVRNEDGSVGQEFVALPRGGIPLDTIEPEAIKGSDSYRQMLVSRNKLLAQLLEHVQINVAPGEVVELPLVVTVRHVKPEGATPVDDAVDFDFGFGAAPAAKAKSRK